MVSKWAYAENIIKPIIHNFYIRYNNIQKPIGMIFECKHVGVSIRIGMTSILFKQVIKSYRHDF